jgi:hypothetical protein
MKKIFFIAVILSVSFIASQASACMWDGYWGGRMGMPIGSYYTNMYNSGNYQGFFDNSSQLRQDIYTKRTELNALLTQPNPDPKRVSQLQAEVTALDNQLVAMAQSSNLPVPSSGYGAYYNRGMAGQPYGPGYGGWACW